MKNKIDFLVALIAEFAQRYGLTDKEAESYMSRHNALELCDKHYEIMHTLSFAENVENIAIYCRKNGGML